MAASVMSSLAQTPAPVLEKSQVKGIPSLVGPSSSFKFQASSDEKIKTDKPCGINEGMNLLSGLDASGRKSRSAKKQAQFWSKWMQRKGVYQFVDKYGANVDGYSPIYNQDKWSSSGDVYVGGTTGFLMWAVTLAGLLASGAALLLYNTSALAQ